MYEIAINGAPGSQILIDRGLLAHPDPSLLLPDRSSRRTVAVIHQPATTGMAGRIADTLAATGLNVATRELPDGDAAKTVAELEALYLWLNSLETTRHDTLLAVGGGAATDVGGFAGGTYLRGIEVINVPTTLLGAVDAAIGGKTGINVGGKNLAGVFKHPARVIVDLDVLDALPRELMVEGSAEVVKAGFIADAAIIDAYERHGLDAPLEQVVPRAIQVKADIVNQDFTEAGVRAYLNYGHTVGHAVEIVCGIPHGHAVAIGMAAAGAAAAIELGFTGHQRQQELIGRLGLPVLAPAADRSEILLLMRLDKKRDESGIRMVLLEDFEHPTITPVGAATVDAALAAVGIS